MRFVLEFAKERRSFNFDSEFQSWRNADNRSKRAVVRMREEARGVLRLGTPRLSRESPPSPRIFESPSVVDTSAIDITLRGSARRRRPPHRRQPTDVFALLFC